MFHIIVLCLCLETLDWNIEGLSSSAVSSQHFEGSWEGTVLFFLLLHFSFCQANLRFEESSEKSAEVRHPQCMSSA